MPDCIWTLDLAGENSVTGLTAGFLFVSRCGNLTQMKDWPITPLNQ